jgi:hypothetical protein
MKYFSGIDVSLRSVSICVIDEAVRFGTSARFPPKQAKGGRNWW